MKNRRVDAIVKNGKIVTPHALLDAALAIDDGKIVAIAKPLCLPRSERTIDAKGNFVLPGVIDAHSHVYDPDFTYREDFISGTKAAAVGGVTTIIDMPLRKPVLSELIKEKIKIGARDSLVDFAFHSGMITEENVHEIRQVAKLGVKSFKVFTCEPFRVEGHSLIRIMKSVSACNGVLVVHAENNDVVSETTKELQEQGRMDPMAYVESRPVAAERKAVSNVIKLARQIGAHVHFAHMTAEPSVGLLKKVKASGQRITAETCPHYLIFEKQNITKLGPYLKMTPPLRAKEDILALWRGLKSGVIDVVATDHAPWTKKEKEIGWKDIWKAPSGIPGVETLLPLMISEGVNKGLISLQDLCRILCKNPAEIFHLYPRKGALQVHSDADIVIVSLKKKSVIKADQLHYKVGWTPYEGMKIKGSPVMTMLRGQVIASHGEIVGRPGYGSFVPMSN